MALRAVLRKKTSAVGFLSETSLLKGEIMYVCTQVLLI